LNPRPRRFHAEVRHNNGQVMAVSEQVTVQIRPHDFQLQISADSPEITVPGSTQVRASVDQDLYNTGYRIHIVEEGGELDEVVCGSGSSCQKGVSAPWSINPNPTARHFRAEVRHVGGQLMASSDPVTVVRRRFLFGVSLTFSSATDANGNVTHTATATSSHSVAGSGYQLKLRRIDGAQTCSSSSGPTCSGTVGPGGTYRATVENAGGHVAGDSGAWTLTGDGPREEAADGVDLVHLAALIGSPTALCQRVLVSPFKTHLNGSSLSDQYIACDAGSALASTPSKFLRGSSAPVGGPPPVSRRSTGFRAT
jgi:hypothetical protein